MNDGSTVKPYKEGGAQVHGTVEADIGYLQDNPEGRPADSDRQELYGVLVDQTDISGRLTDKFTLGGFFDIMLYQFPSGRSGLADATDYHIFGDGVPPLTLALRQYNLYGIIDYNHKGVNPEIAKLRDELVATYEDLKKNKDKQTPEAIQEFATKWDTFRAKVLGGLKTPVTELAYREAFLATVEAKYIVPASSALPATLKATTFADLQDEYTYLLTNKDSPYLAYVKEKEAPSKHDYVKFRVGGIDTSHKQLGDLKYYMGYDGVTPLQMAGKGLGVALQLDQQAADWLFFKEDLGFTMMGIVMLGLPQFGYKDDAIEALPPTFAGSASANFIVGDGAWTPSLELGFDANKTGLAWYVALSNSFEVAMSKKKHLWKPELLLSYSQMLPESGESMDRITFAARSNFELPLGDDDMYKLTISPYIALSRTYAGRVTDQHVTGEVDGESHATDLDQFAGNTGSYENNTGVEGESFRTFDFMLEGGAKLTLENIFTPGLYLGLLVSGASLCNGRGMFCTDTGAHAEAQVGYTF